MCHREMALFEISGAAVFSLHSVQMLSEVQMHSEIFILIGLFELVPLFHVGGVYCKI